MYQKLDQSSDSNDFIEDISIPYIGSLPQRLIVGSFIEILGKMDENVDNFTVNLLTDSDDIALHFNARFKEDSIVRNSRISNDWCNEERETMKMPFERNRSFTLIISVAENAYRIYINGIHFADFSHRLPYNSVASIGIEGEVQVLWIKCDQMDSNHNWDAFSHTLSSKPVTQQPHELQTFYEPKFPFVEEIMGGLREGMVLSIIGRPISNNGKFDINLVQNSPDSKGIPNIALHISVRFGKKSEDSLVVRNYRFGGEWGTEDRYCTEFPFTPEKIFDMRIIVDSHRFIIVINGKNFTEFPIRLFPLSDTNQIEIIGNYLKLLSVRF